MGELLLFGVQSQLQRVPTEMIRPIPILWPASMRCAATERNGLSSYPEAVTLQLLSSGCGHLVVAAEQATWKY